MKTTKLIFGLAFSVLASSAFALPAVNTVNNSDMSKAPLVAEGGTKHTNVGSIRVSADGADHVGANRLAADGADRVGARWCRSRRRQSPGLIAPATPQARFMPGFFIYGSG
ncbi:hypothetical protein A243_18218 [Pseudomonas syringae pv. actinidiae ICMP 18883]|nr:hypothetical protein A243_18218 [Pseudomonas syringae pv. actinidiae ICMP 18883]